MMMRRVNFLICGEHHARIFAPLIKGVDLFTIYRCGTPRNALIDETLHRSGIRSYDRKDLKSIFEDIRVQDEVFVLPLMIGTTSHSLFRHTPGFNGFIKRDLSNNAGTVVVFNEKMYHTGGIPYRHEGNTSYTPHGDILIARSKIEADVLRKQKLTGSKVVLVGDPSVKIGEHAYGDSCGNLLFVTACDPTRKGPAVEIMQEMLAHLEIFLINGNSVDSVSIKPHPGEADSAYIPMIENLCKKYKVKCDVVDAWHSIETLAKTADIAIVQSSFSSHILLRSNGVRSFFYCSDMERNEEKDFFNLSSMPLCKLHHYTTGKYSDEDYDKWVKDTFIVDNKQSERFINGIS